MVCETLERNLVQAPADNCEFLELVLVWVGAKVRGAFQKYFFSGVLLNLDDSSRLIA